jgi:hypothetical protein
MQPQDGMVLIRSRRGLIGHIARSLGLTRGAVAKWDRVPAERVGQVEAATGIPRYLLRPDICPPPQGMRPKRRKPKPKPKPRKKPPARTRPPSAPQQGAGAP